MKNEPAKMSEWAETLKAMMPDCLEQRSDGRFYATENGRLRIQRWLDDKRIPITVTITEDERYDLTHSDDSE